MACYKTYSSNRDFSVDMSVYSCKEFDNEKLKGKVFSLVLITEGKGIAKIGRYSLPYVAPCMFCINEQEHIVIPKAENQQVRVLHFTPSIINNTITFDTARDYEKVESFTVRQDCYIMRTFMLRTKGYHGKYDLGTISEKRILKILDTIGEIFESQSENWPCKSRSYLLELLFFIENLYDSVCSTNDECYEFLDEDFQRILIYLYDNYDKKISVLDVTNEFHISKTTLFKLFKNNLNEPFLQYLNKLRIQIAASMLRDTGLPVSEIMERVGFTDSVHFFRTFKKYLGNTPSEYREQYCWL